MINRNTTSLSKNKNKTQKANAELSTMDSSIDDAASSIDDAQVPLMDSTPHSEGSKSSMASAYTLPKNPILSYRTLVGFTGAMGGLLFGYDSAGVGSVLIQMKAPRSEGGLLKGGLSSLEQSAVVSTMLGGAFLGAVLAAYLNYKIGRKGVLISASATYMVGVSLMAIAGFVHNFVLMLIARVICGFAIGFASSTTPLYIGECGHPKYRGSMIFLNDCCIVIGQCLAAGISSLFVGLNVHGGWRYVLMFGALPALLMFTMFLWQMPESPRWLVSKGKITKARQVMDALRQGEDARDMVHNEVEAIIEEVGSETNVRHTWSMYFTDRRIYRPLRLGMFLQTIQQWVGINTLMYYGSLVLSKSLSGNDDTDEEKNDPFSKTNKLAVYLTIPLAAAQMVGIVGSMFFVDKWGRRPMLFGSLIMAAACLIAMGFAFNQHNVNTAVVFVFMTLYLISFGAGLSPVPWTVNAEIYPLRHRAVCISIATATNWIMCFATSMTFLSLSSVLSLEHSDDHPDGVFWLYSGIAVFALIVLYFGMPETKGVPLEDVGKLFETEEEKALREESSRSGGKKI